MTWVLLIGGCLLFLWLREALAGLILVAVAAAALYTVVASVADYNGGGPDISGASIMP